MAKSKTPTPTKSKTTSKGLGGTPFVKDAAYLIRTVTMTLTGKVDRVVGQFVVLKAAAWIADTGRFNEAIKIGESKLSEVEPVEVDVFVGVGSIVDVYEWKHALPRAVK
jgi:hypothetical protein